MYGYKIEGRKIVIDENAAEVVRYLYTEYAKGEYVRNIIATLTERGIYYKGKPFVRNSVYNILRNEKYSGVYKHGDEVFDNMYPRIIDGDLFEQVRKKVNANKYGKSSVKADFLLRGKLYCGYCGQPMHGESGTTRNGTRIYYYKCNGRKKRINDCKKEMVRKEVIEDIVINATVEKLCSPENIDRIVKELLQIQAQRIKENSILSVLIKQQRQTETALNNLVSAVERGIISNSTNKRLHELERHQEQLERQILIERSKQAVQLKESDIREFYGQALKSEPKMLISSFIRKIKLIDDKIEIYFNSPIRTSPDGETSDDDNPSGLLFYSETIDMVTFKWARTQAYTVKALLELFI